MLFIRFVLGLAIGSFVNVVALRYDPEKPLFANDTINGRSHCPHCKRTLKWFELIPLLSYVFLGGKCRTCHVRLSPRYFLVEAAMGLLFILPFPLPLELLLNPITLFSAQALWLVVIAVLVLMTLIDLRFKIIPDEVHVLLLALGVVNIFLFRSAFAAQHGSFISNYALIFGLQGNIWANHLAAAFFGLLFFALLILVTRGRGMGVGDAKLAFSLGFLFGWPDIGLIVMLAFILGAIAGVGLILRGVGRLKQAVPFGPFLGLAALLVMLFGNQMLAAYFSLFGW